MKSKLFTKLVCITLVATSLLLASGCSSDSSSDNKSEAVTYHVGETVVVGDVEYLVNSISTAKSVGSDILGAQSKGTFLIVNITVKNNGNEELLVSGDLFTLINGDKKFESDSTAGIYANESGTFFLESINPDLSSTGNVIFDISDETISSPDLQLQVQTGIFGTEKELIYLNK